MEFTKMHGLGNDFVLIDINKNPELSEMSEDHLTTLSIFICKRRFGVGADQMLLLLPSDQADFRMRIFNADGSEVEMCGNGIRCLGSYIWEHGLSDKTVLDIETLAGIIRPERRNGQVRVDMGVPAFNPYDIPLDTTVLDERYSEEVIDYPLEIEGEVFNISCVSMGNPHAVIVVDEVKTFPVSYFGPMIENHPLFPNRTNVEFIEVINENEIRMRVWERGAGETMACGTGATASAVIAAKKGLTKRDVKVHLLGGDLYIEWINEGSAYMTGPATTVFDGVLEYTPER
ncbi:MAG: diaminopimelate epimerase [Nitrospirae bacterium]|nr:MAG: diaminopimelate epimerase [Nitrospirota bacterium]